MVRVEREIIVRVRASQGSEDSEGIRVIMYVDVELITRIKMLMDRRRVRHGVFNASRAMVALWLSVTSRMAPREYRINRIPGRVVRGRARLIILGKHSLEDELLVRPFVEVKLA